MNTKKTKAREATGSLKSARPAGGLAASKKQGAAGASVLPARAVKGDLSATLQPQLATLVDGPPNHPSEWSYEIKFDGSAS
jgi:bifunctional non-homologous end joining protein LigD